MKYIIIGIVAIVLSACRKVGCKDINSVTYNEKAKVDDELCTYAYLSAVEIVNIPDFPDYDTLNEGWDRRNINFPGDERPDLQVVISDNFGSVVYASKTFTNNNTYPLFIEINSINTSFIEMNTDYTFYLLDIDNNQNELITKLEFDYIDNVTNDKITIDKGGVKINIFFELRS